HLRDLPNALDHLAGLKLPNLSGTAYTRNVVRAVGNPKLLDDSMATFSRSKQDEVIASALVLLLSGAHIWPLGVEREVSERIAQSWGWSGGENQRGNERRMEDKLTGWQKLMASVVPGLVTRV